ncbi:hypothetical protein [uncultured Friedmanniella sp.]|uniref:hypothetical protein n=1 Tax=uncultured Friedmanniella sp. TaxID=335381 RepID=UPI0035CB8B0C
MDGVSTVVAALAAAVVVVALVFYVVTLVWAGRNRQGSAGPRTQSAGAGSAAAGGTVPNRPSWSLVGGFSYLHVSPRSSAHRAGVQQRLERVIRRVDAVDPYAESRRIGEALLQAGLTTPPPTSRPEDH